MVRHKPTGAEVPVIIKKMTKDFIIEDFQEHFPGRSYFTLALLGKRWSKSIEDVIELLTKYEVPGHLMGSELIILAEDFSPIEKAYFFSEYIEGLELKESLAHKKIKPIKYISPDLH